MIKIVVPVSGGKDSQATALHAREDIRFSNKIIEYVFCDTGWEAPDTYEHIDYFMDAIKKPLIVLKSKKYDGFVDLVKKRGRFPSSTVGFCTEELKIFPMIDWILEQECHLIILQGIRAQESAKRSKMQPNCTYFKYYYEPYKSNALTIERYEAVPPNTLAQKKELEKAKDRLSKGYKDEKYFTYRKKDVFAWNKKYSADIERPFFDATGEDVLNFSISRGFKVHPDYFKGASRVGCAPCKNTGIEELKFYLKHKPEMFDKVREAEQYTGRTFFQPDKIPLKYRTGFDPKSGKKLTTIDDVKRYITDKSSQMEFSDEAIGGCGSVYNICESA